MSRDRSWSWCVRLWSSLGSFLDCALGLITEERFQCVEAPLPLLAEGLEPRVDVLERSSNDQVARAPLRIAPLSDQPSILEDAQVLGDRGLAQAKRLGQLGDRGLAPGKPRQNCSPRRV